MSFLYILLTGLPHKEASFSSDYSIRPFLPLFQVLDACPASHIMVSRNCTWPSWLQLSKERERWWGKTGVPTPQIHYHF